VNAVETDVITYVVLKQQILYVYIMKQFSDIKPVIISYLQLRVRKKEERWKFSQVKIKPPQWLSLLNIL